MAEPSVTEEQAEQALQQLMGTDQTEPTGSEQPEMPALEPAEADTPPEPVEAAPAPVEDAGEAPVDVPAGEVTEVDDVVSLRQRLADAETAKTRYNDQVAALQRRNADNTRISHERYLRKSNVADRALKTLEGTRTEAGISEADVDRTIAELRGTMNPASANYAPPAEQRVPAEDQATAMNNFMNEKAMTNADEEEFAKWIKFDAGNSLSPVELAVADRDLDGFLRLAHVRWQDGIRQQAVEQETKRADTVKVVKSVQRTQREAARAASASGIAPKKQPVSPATGTDTSKMTEDERTEYVSGLLRQSVEQYQ